MKHKCPQRTARFWIKLLHLKKHPEGGYYREAYRSGEMIADRHLPNRYNGGRSFATAIYFLLNGKEYSAFHRLKSDEIWHFYDGTSVCIYMIEDNGVLVKGRLGLNVAAGDRPQFIIKMGTWFAAKPDNPRSYTLLGCTVAPGFDFADFEIGRRRELIRQFPRHRALIAGMTRPEKRA